MRSPSFQKVGQLYFNEVKVVKGVMQGKSDRIQLVDYNMDNPIHLRLTTSQR